MADDILSILSQHNVFTVERVKDGLEITEGCDGYFRHTLSDDEVRQLALELIAALDRKPLEESRVEAPFKTPLDIQAINREAIRLWRNNNAFIREIDKQYG